MAADQEQLVVLLEARIRDFEKNMAKASGTATKSYSGMRRGSKTATAAMEADMLRSTSAMNRALAATSTRMGGIAKSGLAGMTGAFLAGVAPILSVAAALRTAKEALSEFDAIGKSAKSAGVDAEFFQELSYSAQLGGVEVGQLSQALNSMTRNVGMAAVGKGELVEKLKQLHPELLKNILAATDQETRIRLVADALDAETDASRKAAIAAAVFGDAGVKMVEMLKGGAAALDQTAQKARQLGLVIDNNLIARAETLNDEFSTATRVMDLQFKQALIDLAPFLISTAQLAGNLAAAINYMSASMSALSDRSTQRLEEDYNGLKATLDQANAEYAPGVVGTGAMGVSMDPETQARMQAEADAMRAELKRRAMAKLTADLSKPKLEPFELPETAGAGAGGANAAADATIKQAEAVQALIADLQHEQEQLGRTANEQELYNALKSVGVTAESEFGQAIADTLRPLQEQREAIEANAAMMDMLGDIGKSAVNGIIDALDDGKITAEEFGDILGNVLSMAGQFFLDAAFSGLGGGGGGFNLMSLFQKRETGGPVKKGQPYIVGERRPEVFVPDQSGRILPSISDASGSSAPGASLTYAPVIDARGADAGAVARLEKILVKQAAEFESKVIRVVQSGRNGRFKPTG